VVAQERAAAVHRAGRGLEVVEPAQAAAAVDQAGDSGVVAPERVLAVVAARPVSLENGLQQQRC